MQYTIKSHRLCIEGNPVGFQASPNRSGVIRPEGIILHDTAGRLDKGSSVGWFMQQAAKASAHLVVERDGSVTQMVPFNIKAWHAGKSILNGRSGCNAFSVGIEIVNPGKMEKVEDGYQPWFKRVYTERDGEIRAASTRHHGDGYWMDYTEAQLQVVSAICCALVSKYDMTFIEPHWFISPGRKVDTNPLFPLERVRSLAFGRAEGAGESANRQVNATSLNVRGGPGIEFEKMDWGPLTNGATVQVLEQDQDERGQTWSYVAAGENKGWVCDRYLSDV